MHASHGYSELDRGRLSRMHFDHEEARAFLAGREPFVVSEEQHQAIRGAKEIAAGRRFAVAPLSLDGGRLGCIAVAPPEDAEFTDRHLRLLAGIAHQASSRSRTRGTSAASR